MDQNLKQNTLDNLAKAQSILVIVADNSGFDGLASGLSLFLASQKFGKNASIFAKSPTVGDAQKLYGVDQIGKAQGAKNLVVVVENAVDTVDRVSHYLDGDKLKLILHAFPGSKGPSKEEVSMSEEIMAPDVVFAVGFESEELLKEQITHVQNISPNAWLINVSKVDMGQIFAQVNYFEFGSSSVSEVTAKFISDLAMPIDEDIAFNLYEGIAQSTKRFDAGLVGQNTFDVASWLVKFGAGKASFAAKEEKTSDQPKAIPFTVDQKPQNISNLQQDDPKQSRDKFVLPDLSEFDQTPIEQVEREKETDKDWLAPPKIYKGSKSFDGKE